MGSQGKQLKVCSTYCNGAMVEDATQNKMFEDARFKDESEPQMENAYGLAKVVTGLPMYR